MSYFTIGKIFLIPSFDLDEEEVKEIEKFLLFLEKSGVGNVISKYVQNNTSNGGRPGCNYYRLFASIIYSFAFDKGTLRDLERQFKINLIYIYIMQQERVDYSTICKFINKVILPNEKEIFGLLCKEIMKETEIELEDGFIDGTKFEANANKYKFVWKPTTFHKRLSLKANEIINKYNLIPSFKQEDLIRSSTVALALSNVNKNNFVDEKEYTNVCKIMNSFLVKIIEYEEKEYICGPNRNSFYKTDKDATAMALKADYYSGLGTNMHAAYNVQILVIKGFVFSYLVSQSRSDYDDFIPTLEIFYQLYGKYPSKICADAGYGIKCNYKYLNDHSIQNYVKYQSWEGNVSGARPDIYYLNDDDSITCLNGCTGYEEVIPNRHQKYKNTVFYVIRGCLDCDFAPYCKRLLKNQNQDYKIFEIDKENQRYKQQATANLLSPKGIEIRVNRSIQVEGVFGIVKQDFERTRFKRRGLDRVSLETMLMLIGHNIAKLFRYFKTNQLNRYWIAPNNLDPETFKKPSAKKLSKKGKKINENYYKEK